MSELVSDPRRVLIIDQEGDFTRALGLYLSDLGLRVSTASRWTAALEGITRDSPHAILLNPHLQTVSGETILRFLRDEGNPIPVVVVADHLAPDRVKDLKGMGANAFVQKTDAFYQIAQALSGVLPGWSAEAAPVITEEEFERIMVQRLGEVMEGEEPGSSRSAPQAEPATPPAPASRPEASRPPIAGDDAKPAPPRRGRIEPDAAADGRRGSPLPPPPPIPPEPAVKPERRVRRRRVVKKSAAGRVFFWIFLICLVTGAIYLGLTMGLSDFVKGNVKPPAEQAR